MEAWIAVLAALVVGVTIGWISAEVRLYRAERKLREAETRLDYAAGQMGFVRGRLVDTWPLAGTGEGICLGNGFASDAPLPTEPGSTLPQWYIQSL